MEFLKGDGARTGLFFGATSGVITTIGLIVGLNSGTRSITAVLGGILVIAVADAMSDALGIHLAEESDPATSHAARTSRHGQSSQNTSVLRCWLSCFLILLASGSAGRLAS